MGGAEVGLQVGSPLDSAGREAVRSRSRGGRKGGGEAPRTGVGLAVRLDREPRTARSQNSATPSGHHRGGKNESRPHEQHLGRDQKKKKGPPRFRRASPCCFRASAWPASPPGGRTLRARSAHRGVRRFWVVVSCRVTYVCGVSCEDAGVILQWHSPWEQEERERDQRTATSKERNRPRILLLIASFFFCSMLEIRSASPDNKGTKS